MKKNKIFVQIASYRDPELKPTLKNMLENADKPDNLVICIAHQFSKDDKWDNLDEYKNDVRFKVIPIPAEESKGACWARNQIQQHYNNEEYTLQLDSHHRFVEGWDTKVISMYEKLRDKGHKKPLLTSYIPSYDPNNDPEGRVNKPWAMQFDRFTPEGVIFFLPYWLDNKVEDPIPARFYSAHFCFTTGEFAKEVQHDPEMYFHGEEISIAVRAFTHGYDLFHPNEIIAWHEYTREGRTKHWDDHTGWHEVNLSSHERMRKLLGIDGACAPCARKKLFKEYGTGTERTIAEYEEYAGVRFNDRAVRQSTLDNEIPTLGIKDEPYNLKFRHALDIYAPEYKGVDDYDFVAIIFEDKDGKEVYRKDEDGKVFQTLVDSNEGFFPIWREANIEKPYQWVIWPHSASKGWLKKKITKI